MIGRGMQNLVVNEFAEYADGWTRLDDFVAYFHSVWGEDVTRERVIQYLDNAVGGDLVKKTVNGSVYYGLLGDVEEEVSDVPVVTLNPETKVVTIKF